MWSRIICILLIVSTVAIAKHLQAKEFPGDSIENIDDGEWLFDDLGSNGNRNKRETNVCDTDACKTLAQVFQKGMNTSVDPCDNFYDYVCGAMNGRMDLIPPHDGSWGSIELFQHTTYNRIRAILEQVPDPADLIPVRLAKKWYSTCMNLEERERRGIKPIENIVNQAGGWPMVMEPEEFAEDDFTWQDLEKNYFYLTGKFVFYTIESFWDRWTDEYQINIADPRMPLMMKLPWGFRDTESGIETYKSLLTKIAKKFVEHSKTAVTDEMIKEDVEDMIEFEKKLSNLGGPYGRSIDTTIGEFIAQYNEDATNCTLENRIHLVQIFTLLCNSVNMDVEQEQRLRVQNYPFFVALTELFDETSKRTIANYIHWAFVSNAISYTTSEMENLLKEAAATETGVQTAKPRWIECVQDTKLEEAISYSFASHYYDERIGMTATEMINNIRELWEAQIEKSKWPDSETKAMMLDKLRTMRLFLGFPDWYRNETAVNQLYRGLRLGYDYFENMLNFDKYRIRKDFLNLKRESGERPWETQPSTINAQYSQEKNEIYVPAAVVQAPFFTPNLPDVINYGIIGFIIAHEIGHGYDNDDFDHNKEGKKVKLPDETVKRYFERADCFIDQFNGYAGVTEPTVVGTTPRPNKRTMSIGRRTRPDNIADTTGLHAAFEAWKKVNSEKTGEQGKLPGFEQYTDEQMFFIANTVAVCQIQRPSLLKMLEKDEHSLAPTRNRGVLSNSKEFARVFNCPMGSRMNPEKKCNIWDQNE